MNGKAKKTRSQRLSEISGLNVRTKPFTSKSIVPSILDSKRIPVPKFVARNASQEKNSLVALAVEASYKTYIEGLGDKLLIAAREPKCLDLLGMLLAAGAIVEGKEIPKAEAMGDGFIDLLARTPVFFEVSPTGEVSFRVGDRFSSKWGLGRKDGGPVQIDNRISFNKRKSKVRARTVYEFNFRGLNTELVKTDLNDVIDILTRQFVDTCAAIAGKDQKEVMPKGESVNNNRKLIFISHASADVPIIQEFVDNILKNGLGLEDENIVCTSLESTTVEPGESIPSYIMDNIANANVVLEMVSEAYIKSEACQNEVGMAKALRKDIICITLPDVDFEKINWFEKLNKAIRIDAADSLNHLQETLCHKMGLKIKTALHWNPCVNKFLNTLKKGKAIAQ